MKKMIAAITMAAALAAAAPMPAALGWGAFDKWTKKHLSSMYDGDCYKYLFTGGKKGGKNCSF